MVAKHTHEAFRGIFALLFALTILSSSASAVGAHAPQDNDTSVIGSLSGTYRVACENESPSYRFKTLDLVVDEPIRETVYELLDISPTQRETLEPAYVEYREQVTAKDQELADTIAQIKAELDIGEGDLEYSRKHQPDWSKVAVMQYRIDVASAAIFRECDQHLETFWQTVTEVIAESQRLRMERVRRVVRRMNWERRHRQEIDGYDGQTNFNLYEVLRLAKESIPEFGRLISNFDRLSERELQARLEIIQYLTAYAIQFDHDQQQWYQLARTIPKEPVDLRLKPGDPRWQRIRRTRLAWYDAMLPAINGIQSALTGCYGSKVGLAWRDLFYAKFYSNLYWPRRPDVFESWLTDRSDATDEQLDAAKDIVFRYKQHRTRLRRKAVEIAIRNTRRELRGHRSEVDSGEYPYCTKLLELRNLIEQTTDEFMAILNHQQKKEFVEWRRNSGLSNPRLDGPFVPESIKTRISDG